MKYTEQQAQEIYRNLFKDGLLSEVPNLVECAPDWARIDNEYGIATAIKLSILHWGGYVSILKISDFSLYGAFKGTPVIIKVEFNPCDFDEWDPINFQNAGGWFINCRTYADFLNVFTDRFGLTLDENGNLME